jgi:hypothetical protein
MPRCGDRVRRAERVPKPTARAGRARGFWASLCALLAGGLLAPTLAGAWTPPVNLSEPGQNASFPQVAVDGAGDAFFTWVRSDGTNSRIQAVERSASGILSHVQTLSSPGQDAFDPQVAVDTAGEAVFVWRRYDGTSDRIQARARSTAGILSPVQTLSSSGQHASDPQVAVRRGTGDAVFAWRRSDGTNFRIQARARTAAGTLSAVQTLSSSGQNAGDPRVAVDDGGDAVFAWVRFDGTNYRAQALGRTAAGILSPVQTLSSSGQTAYNPQVAVRVGNGDAVFSWRRSDGTNSRVQARARTAAGGLSAIQTLSAAGQDAFEPGVAVDGAGDAVFTWQRSDGANLRIQARARTAAGALGAVQTLSSSGQSAYNPEVAVRRKTGDAFATWQRSDGTNSRIQASAGP